MKNKVLHIGALVSLLAILLVTPIAAQTPPGVPRGRPEPGMPHVRFRTRRPVPAQDTIWRWAEQLVELEDVLGVSLAEMVEMHEDGMTLQDMAQEQDVDWTEVLLCVCPAAQRFDRLVQEGHISESTAREMSLLVCERRTE